MLAAQNTEESTKLRAKAVGDQVGREKKRHEEAVAQLMEEIERCRKTEQESHAAEGTLAKTLEEKAQQESKLAKERIMAYMRDKGHQPSPPTTTYRDPAPHIDRKHFEKEEHRNKEAWRQAKAAAHEVKRKEEERLKNRERLRAELQLDSHYDRGTFQHYAISFCAHAIQEKVGRRVVIPSNNIELDDN
jgi:hypothetical protein